ncbi:MAG: RNA-binding transcriptional accessory protein [Lachnospiraceae bacterium]|nr:RNA-binding transcriptional accessory protein [Lachnospiraceae bacterium]
MDINATIAKELGIRKEQVEATVRLIDEGNTIPFIARYRKEVTGALNDEVLRNLYDRLMYLRALEEKKAQVIASIAEQGVLTEELKKAILDATTQVAVDDLYLPYRPKRRTRATIAKEKGLEPLANLILLQQNKEPIEKIAESYINPEKEVNTVEDAINGAKDIIAEGISENADYRAYIRDYTVEHGQVVSKAKDTQTSTVYDTYYDFTEPVKKILGHRILAINRGENEKVLTVKIAVDETRVIEHICKDIIKNEVSVEAPILREAIEDAYDRLIAPSIEREVRNMLTEKAEDGAIKVFGENLSQLLMQPPIQGKVVLGWDPAFRTGCKLAVVDETGKVIFTTVIFPTAPQNRVEESKKILKDIIHKYHVNLISVGNGTASRESERVIADLISELDVPVSYAIVNEAGASVYSASKLATEEFPNFDVGQRSAASIARRLQDPLAELVKIEPKAIGVGQYQHDMNQKKLGEALNGVVECCVNKVGVDLNTASAPLLSYISGISGTIAKNIVAYREENGRFKTREELKKVSKLGPKAFEQCAGFMRIIGGDDPLDSTAVHPESYAATRALLNKLGVELSEIGSAKVMEQTKKIKDYKALAEELNVGEYSLKDIVAELDKPGRDPRLSAPAPILRQDVMELTDLKEGMVLKGTVRNVIDFGAFVDIGVHQDGLVHVSQMSDRYIKHPLDVVSVGDIVDVKVMSVDLNKKRIQLTMKGIKNGQ